MSTAVDIPTSDWPTVTAAIRGAKILVVGQDDIKNEAQAAAATAVIRAFGDSPAGFIYFEPCTARSTRRPPDIVLCHPKLGIVVLEVKGYSRNNIESVNAGSLFVRHQGHIRPVNAFRQAEQAMYDIKNQVDRNSNSGSTVPAFNAVVVLPNVTQKEWTFSGSFPEDVLLLKDDLEPARLKKKLEALVGGRQSRPLMPEQIETVKAVFGDSATINDSRELRQGISETALGALIDEIAVMDKYLSAEQTELSRLTIGGFPRLVRGVAGSGKTVVLANIVARMLNRRQNADPKLFDDFEDEHIRIAVLCFNRALVSFLRQKIKDAYKQQTFEDVPQGDALWVGHLNSLMRKLTYGRGAELQYIPIESVKDASERATQYERQLQAFIRAHPALKNEFLYDAIFIDEGQDFEPAEFQLLLSLLKPDPKTGEKNLIIFYDDAQNLYGRQRPKWKEIGIDVGRGDRAKVMKECFRNTKEIVEVAFNVLLGAEASAEDKVNLKSYADVGYLRQSGLVEEIGAFYKVGFAERTGDYPRVQEFTSRNEEKQWVVSEVERLICQEHVRPEDILILFSYGELFEDMPRLIRHRVNSEHVEDFIQPYGKHGDRDSFIFREKCVTLSTVHGAKGYDAYIVFLVGVDLFRSDEAGRASLYVGATRSKLMLYASGMHSPLLSEMQRVIARASALRKGQS